MGSDLIILSSVRNANRQLNFNHSNNKYKGSKKKFVFHSDIIMFMKTEQEHINIKNAYGFFKISIIHIITNNSRPLISKLKICLRTLSVQSRQEENHCIRKDNWMEFDNVYIGYYFL